ncbi:MAG TPA: LacI family transcriptional regulator, partial [Ruminococcaceae bacterium]|nr:LacI family transcriptional regulator [Oscillospiraceae bacterium]
AIGALTAANELNVRLPDDLSFLTFDDDEIFNSTDPPITSVVQNFDEMGKRAAELIVRRVKGDYSRFPQTQLIKTTLIRRASVRDLNRRP